MSPGGPSKSHLSAADEEPSAAGGGAIVAADDPASTSACAGIPASGGTDGADDAEDSECTEILSAQIVSPASSPPDDILSTPKEGVLTWADIMDEDTVAVKRKMSPSPSFRSRSRRHKPRGSSQRAAMDELHLHVPSSSSADCAPQVQPSCASRDLAGGTLTGQEWCAVRSRRTRRTHTSPL